MAIGVVEFSREGYKIRKVFTLLTAEVIKWQKCAHMGLNGFHIKCISGTHCN